ncbi:MAG: ABC transporter ATP-binding protein [Firmicutes bacterium]|nr:ABC transporter ATP-binding protein [Bacillota bacterium]
MTLIRIENLDKTYFRGKIEVQALKNINLEIKENEFVAVVGPSGSGKSTLMNIMGCLDTPTRGRYLLDGIDVGTMDEDELAEIRNKKIGFVFQSFNLLPQLTALENVELPLIYRRMPSRERIERAVQALEMVGLKDRLDHRPSELSGGQQQRVSIARAIAGAPSIILADEPTGNLDSNSGVEILKIFKDLHKNGTTLIIITHDMGIAEKAPRRFVIKDGRIIKEGKVS